MQTYTNWIVKSDTSEETKILGKGVYFLKILRAPPP